MYSAPVAAVVGLAASPLELTILVSAYPVGAFLGPVWAAIGERWGMKRLVLAMWFLSSLPLLFIFCIKDPTAFTLLITISQLLNGGMRIGQSSLYSLVYPADRRGRALGQITFWTFASLVQSVLATGWLLDHSGDAYRVLYPLGGISGIIGCYYYSLLRVPCETSLDPERRGLYSGLRRMERVLHEDRLYGLFQAAFFLTGGALFLTRHVIIVLSRERFGYSAFELLWCLSVLPQLLLAVGSPAFGRILDRLGMIPCRLLISLLLSVSLASHFLGLALGASCLMYVGSVIQGLSNAGGQVTWFLASSHFAPRHEDVPAYSGIHFVLNGTRGLILPWIGSVLMMLSGTGAVLAATVFSLGSMPVLWQALRLGDRRSGQLPWLCRVARAPWQPARARFASIGADAQISLPGGAQVLK